MALRTYGDAALPKPEKNASTLAKWILKTKPKTINTRELQRTIKLEGLRDSASIHTAINILIDADWIKPSGVKENKATGRKRCDFIVNEEIFF